MKSKNSADCTQTVQTACTEAHLDRFISDFINEVTVSTDFVNIVMKAVLVLQKLVCICVCLE